MTGSLRKSVTIGACLVFIVMDRRADFYNKKITKYVSNYKKIAVGKLTAKKALPHLLLPYWPDISWCPSRCRLSELSTGRSKNNKNILRNIFLN
jgi:hypothetical protein